MPIQKNNIQRFAISSIGRAGVEVAKKSASAVAAQIQSFLQKNNCSSSSSSVARSLQSLKRKRFVRWDWTGKQWRLSLTEQGETELSCYELSKKLIKRPARWDGKWRALIFDIREEKKYIRDRVRSTLFAFGFYRLQDSVWVFPFDCEEVLELLRTKYHIRYEAQFLLVEYLSNDRWLRKHFHLDAA